MYLTTRSSETCGRTRLGAPAPASPGSIRCTEHQTLVEQASCHSPLTEQDSHPNHLAFAAFQASLTALVLPARLDNYVAAVGALRWLSEAKTGDCVGWFTFGNTGVASGRFARRSAALP
jgi:hypothetical protein